MVSKESCQRGNHQHESGKRTRKSVSQEGRCRQFHSVSSLRLASGPPPKTALAQGRGLLGPLRPLSASPVFLRLSHTTHTQSQVIFVGITQVLQFWAATRLARFGFPRSLRPYLQGLGLGSSPCARSPSPSQATLRARASVLLPSSKPEPCKRASERVGYPKRKQKSFLYFFPFLAHRASRVLNQLTWSLYSSLPPKRLVYLNAKLASFRKPYHFRNTKAPKFGREYVSQVGLASDRSRERPSERLGTTDRPINLRTKQSRGLKDASIAGNRAFPRLALACRFAHTARKHLA